MTKGNNTYDQYTSILHHKEDFFCELISCAPWLFSSVLLTIFVNLERSHRDWEVCYRLLDPVSPESREAGKAKFETPFVQS
jgi:hypothetical protein